LFAQSSEADSRQADQRPCQRTLDNERGATNANGAPGSAKTHKHLRKFGTEDEQTNPIDNS
jgi:hypothetical protein